MENTFNPGQYVRVKPANEIGVQRYESRHAFCGHICVVTRMGTDWRGQSVVNISYNNSYNNFYPNEVEAIELLEGERVDGDYGVIDKIDPETGELLGYNIRNLASKSEAKFYTTDEFDDEFTYCDNCGCIVLRDATEYCGEDGICPFCYEKYTATCCCCDERIWKSDSHCCEDSSEPLCEYCYESETYYCEDCGHTFRYADSGSWRGDYWYCSDCRNDSDRLAEYHDFKNSGDIEFRYTTAEGKDGDPRGKIPFIGTEIEIDGGYATDAALDAIEDYEWGGYKRYIHSEEDGSLNSGFENITQPSSIGYFIEHENDFKGLFKQWVNLEYSAHINGNCGLHTHLDRKYFGDERAQELAIAKLLIIFEKHWDNMLRFSRRKSDQVSSWCQRRCQNGFNMKEINDYAKGFKPLAYEPWSWETRFYTYYERKNGKFKKLEKYAPFENGKYYSKQSDTRYLAVNLTNSETVEIRLWRGSLNIETFMATMKFTDRIARLCKEESVMRIWRMSWEEILGNDQTIASYWARVKDRTI